MDPLSHESKPSSSWQRPAAITAGSISSIALLALGAWGIYTYHLSSVILFSCAIVTEGGGASILLATVFKGCKQATKQIQQQAQSRPELPRNVIPREEPKPGNLDGQFKEPLSQDVKDRKQPPKEPGSELPVQSQGPSPQSSSIHSSQMQPEELPEDLHTDSESSDEEPPFDSQQNDSLPSSSEPPGLSTSEDQGHLNNSNQVPVQVTRVLTPMEERQIARFSERGKKDPRELDRFNQLLPDRRIYVLRNENNNNQAKPDLRDSLENSSLRFSSIEDNRGWSKGFKGIVASNLKALQGYVSQKITDLQDKFAETVTDLQSKNLFGGEYQRRLHFQLLSSLLDPLALYFSGEKPECNAGDKIEIIYNLINKHPKLKALFQEKAEEGTLSFALYSCLNVLFALKNYSSEENYLLWRQEFIQHLNQGYGSFEYKKAMKEFERGNFDENTFKEKYPQAALLQFLGSSIFNQVHLFDFAAEIYSDVAVGEENNVNNAHPSSSRDPLIATMKEVHEKALYIPDDKGGGKNFTNLHKTLGGLNVAFKPMENNNYANTLWRAGYERNDGLFRAPMRIRFATPTAEKMGSKPSIIPQFKLFLDACRIKKQKIVSFQLQNPTPKLTRVGNEAHRLELMQELSQDPSYKGTYLFVGLPLDGDFFNQKGKYTKLENVEEFKAEFLCHLFGGRGYSTQISSAVWELCSKNYQQEVKEILNHVHQIFFKNADTLSAKERRIFQIIAYSLLEEYILMGTGADYYHDQCKDAIDRAMLMVIVNYYLSQVRLGKENETEVQKNLLVLTEYMAVLAKSTGMHHGRFDLLLEVLTHLRSLTIEEKSRFQASPIIADGIEFRLRDLLIPSNINLTYTPLPSEAPTKEEYQNRLQTYPGFSQEISRFPNYLLVSEHLSPSVALTDLCKQWGKDVERQGYCINGKEFAPKGLPNRTELIENYFETWCFTHNFDPDYIKSLTTQKVTAWATSRVFQGFGYFDSENGSSITHVKQRDLKDESKEWGTYINLINDQGNRCFIEAIQFFQVMNMETGSLNYIRTSTIIDLQTEIATINIYQPTTEYELPFSHHQHADHQVNNNNQNIVLASAAQKIREKLRKHEQRIAELQQQLNDSFVNMGSSNLSASDLESEKLNSTIDNRELVSSNNSDSNPHTD